VISAGGVSGGKVTGAPNWMVSSLRWARRQGVGKILQAERGDGGSERRLRTGDEGEFDAGIRDDAGGKFER
jgi:hypothetical protein